MEENAAPRVAAALEWQYSGQICALSDGERHIGHVVKIGGRWHAFDAMHGNDTGDGFQSLGTFVARESAITAVESGYRLPLPPFAGSAQSSSKARTAACSSR